MSVFSPFMHQLIKNMMHEFILSSIALSNHTILLNWSVWFPVYIEVGEIRT